jgi:hypothetical protein
MTARQQLDTYLEQLQRRLRVRTTLRGAAILASAALVTTVVLVLIANALRFSGASLTLSRIVLFAIIAACIAFACIIPLVRLNRRRSAWEAETIVPDFQHRLVTLAEREHEHENQGAFAELLAADTLKIARQHAEVVDVVPKKDLLISLGTALASVAVLLWIILAGPGFLGYGAALLWAGSAGAAPLYDLRVTPGDATVRRNSDQMISAVPHGLQTNDIRIYARYENTSKWDQLPMEPQPGTSNFQFLFAGLPEGVEYYVEAGELRSPHFHIQVTDVPAVKQIRVTYRYPSWTGIPSATDDHGGDLHAMEGTDADLEITMDRPLTNGVLVLDDDHQIQLGAGSNNLYTGTIHLAKDGAYHVAALDRGESVRISEDYFINATKADAPDVVIARPAGDYHASPIEEVTVQAKADDAFGLRAFALHYSVNGGADQTLNLLPKAGQKDADGSTVLRMEDFKAVPGDIVSIYATAKDAHAESRTDMFFIQAEPFERDYSQSQQAGGGGGGGGGNAPDEISKRQKEIIGATWKQLGQKNGTAESAAQNAKFLSGVQAKLHDQAVSLANRLQMRGLDGGNDEFDAFQKSMNAAAAAMTPAADTLRTEKWKDSIPHEQQALQYLLRAEATFRQIQVAFGAAGGAGGAGGSAGRDLASLFDLELDTQKNQYETAQTGNSAAQQSEKVDEALRKLDELARREEKLAQQNNQNLTEQRWQQEMLRREAEELQKQIEQLTRSDGNSQSNSPDGQPSGQSSSSGGSSDSDPRVQQALNQLRQANDEMRRANSQGQQGQGQADARDAAQRLRDAKNLLGGTQRQQNSGRLDSLAQEANRLANEQRNQSDRIRSLSPGNSGEASEEANNGPAGNSGRDSAQSLAEDRQKLADDLAHLESQMRDAVRDLAGGNRDAASKLRDALRQADQSDLDTRVQRSADMLRRGMSPDRNGSESQIGSDLQKMEQQTRDAQQSLGNGGQQQDDSQDALNQVQTLRDRLQALDRNSQSRGASGKGVQGGQRGGQQPGQQAGQQPGQQPGPGGQNGSASAFVSPNGGNGGPAYGGMNAGNNVYNYGQMPSPPDGYANPAPEQAYRDSMAQLDQLRQTAKDDPESLRQVQDLIREMQRLDPSRFPGNPAMIEELHNRVLADVDKLALEVRRASEGKQSGQVHGTDSQPVPAGYEDAVADYFRRLSKTP